MEPGKVAFENIEATPSKFDTVIELLLGAFLSLCRLLSVPGMHGQKKL